MNLDMTKIIIDIGHPAHVHHFKNLIKEMKEDGYDVVVCKNRTAKQ
jgi:predicted glycosyltransferase